MNDLVNVIGVALVVGTTLIAWRCWRRLAVTRIELGQLTISLEEFQKKLLAKDKILAEREALRRIASHSSVITCRSQHGEDVWLWDYFGRRLEGFFVEAGAHNGLAFSNSAFFEDIGWTGLLVEPHPELFDQCVKARPNSTVVNAALGDLDAKDSIPFSMVQGNQGADLLSFSVTNPQSSERGVGFCVSFRFAAGAGHSGGVESPLYSSNGSVLNFAGGLVRC